MSIIIRSSDIYDKNNHNILLNNTIKSVSVQEKILEIGSEGKVIESEQYVANSIFDDSILRLPSTTEKLKLEAYYTTGSIIIPSSEISVDILKNNVSWELSGISVGEDEYDAVTTDKLPEDPLNASIGALYSLDQFDLIHGSPTYATVKDFSQTGLWGNNGLIIEAKGSAKIEYRDKSSITDIEKQTNGDWKISFNILTRVSVLNAYLQGLDRHYSFRGRLFDIENIKLKINTKSVNISDAKTQVLVGDTSKGQPFAMDENQLVQPDTTINNERIALYNANKILKDWGKGKESVEIDVMVGEYYDENGVKQISTKHSELPMTFRIGDLVTPYVSASKEFVDGENTYMLIEEVPLSEYENGTAKNFDVYDIQQINDGIGFQRLKLIESAGRAVTVKIEDTTSTLKINRITSAIADAKTGEISTTDPIYIGDEIQITASGDIREWFVSNNGIYIADGADESNVTVTFTVDGDIKISIIAKEWRLVRYPLTSDYSTKNFEKQDSTLWNYSTTLDFGDDNFTATTTKEWGIRISYYRATDGATIRSDWFTITGGRDDESVGNGCSISIGSQEFPYIYPNELGHGNELILSVKENAAVEIKNRRTSEDGYLNYITSIDLYVLQYEYS